MRHGPTEMDLRCSMINDIMNWQPDTERHRLESMETKELVRARNKALLERQAALAAQHTQA